MKNLVSIAGWCWTILCGIIIVGCLMNLFIPPELGEEDDTGMMIASMVVASAAVIPGIFMIKNKTLVIKKKKLVIIGGVCWSIFCCIMIFGSLVTIFGLSELDEEVDIGWIIVTAVVFSAGMIPGIFMIKKGCAQRTTVQI